MGARFTPSATDLDPDLFTSMIGVEQAGVSNDRNAGTRDNGLMAGGKRSTTIEDLYRRALPATRTGPLYNAFSYPTKISPEAIALFIATHTKPGAHVLDAFGGSGTTGLATLLCDRPTTAMQSLADKLGLNPNWGPRTAHLFEIGVLGSFVSRNLCAPPEPVVFAKAAKELIRRANDRVAWMYRAIDPDGGVGVVRHIIWSEVLVCPDCRYEVSYWQAAVKRSPLSLSTVFACPSCGGQNKTESCERSIEESVDAFGDRTKQRKRIPVRLYGKTGKKSWSRDVTDEDRSLIQQVADAPLPVGAPNAELEWGDLHRTGYHTGIEKLHHFYTKRNFIAIAALLELIREFPARMQEPLRLMVLSYNSSHSTLMTRVVIKKGQRDLVLTGAQSGVLYISGLPVEKNVLAGMERKAKALAAAFKVVHGSRSVVHVNNVSSERMALPDESIDYVFTDPPFGDYIPYAEANQINELWLDNRTDKRHEIVVSRSQGKGIVQYGDMLSSVFQEVARVLKPTGRATVVFHSAHTNVWRALSEAFIGAGFSVKATSVLDKIQASFKQVVSTVSVKGDALLLLEKSLRNADEARTADEIADDVLQDSLIDLDGELDARRLYSEFVGRCLKQGIEVAIGAKEFYQKVQRFKVSA